ncbi:MAG: HPr family phosphocarrier protein [Methylophilaceae bacterium]
MTNKEVEIINKLGLHARASTKLTQTASQFTSDIWITRNGRRVNAKSIMGVMMLAAAKGSFVTLEANGVDEQAAIDALTVLITNYFGEGE